MNPISWRKCIRARRAVLPALMATTMLSGIPFAHAQDTGGLETVVVTAEKREENLQKVPMNVQAFTEEKLSEMHLTDFDDFSRYMPSVTWAASGQGGNGGPGFANITMRGIASDQNGNHSGPLPTVGVYLDEQPISTIDGTLDIPTYDIQRVEALSGPQGTLYGASSLSGTIRIITNKPDPSGFEASYSLDANSVDHGGIGYSGHGMINIPIADNAAIRIVAWDEHDAGYIDNVFGTRTYDLSQPPSPDPTLTINNAGFAKNNYNTVDKVGARAALQVDLDNNWTITPAFTIQSERTDGVFGEDPLVGDLEVTHFSPEYAHDNWYQASLTVQGKISNLDVVYSGGYMHRIINQRADYSDYTYWYDQLDGTNYATFTDNSGNIINPSQQLIGKDGFTKESHELRISTPKDDRFRVVAGLFYEKQTHRILQDYFIPGMADADSVDGWPGTLYLADELRTDRDYAAFAEANFDITPSLTLTGGIRLFKSDNSLFGFFGFQSYETPPHDPHCKSTVSYNHAPCTDIDDDVKSSGETHKVNLAWQIDPDKMVYATYSTGFRPGGANRVADVGTYSPDTLTNYEIGFKTTWDNDRLRANGALYWEDWDNIQFSYLGPNSITIVKNGKTARVRGIEYDVSYLPIDNLTISSSGAYNEADLTSPFCADASITNCTNALADAPAGTQLPITPKWKVNASARYDFNVGDLNAHVQGSMVHQSGFFADLRLYERGLLGKVPGSTTFDFTTGGGMGNWTVELYVNNVFDDRAELGRYPGCNPDTCGNETYRLVAQPRTIGLTFSQKFD
jgi:outer membrane receptor protein involved in Fe transport